MANEILKYGAMIVDSLREYEQPVFVYIPPGGELRGGAWVVIDPTINEARMEMFADVESRGGILEPPGVCEVKFRESDQRRAMHRLDPILKKLDDEDIAEADDVRNRESLLGPLYMQIAHEFADLHDRTGRMKAKGVISEALTWRHSREYFYWHLRRRLAEDNLVKKYSKSQFALERKEIVNVIRELLEKTTTDPNDDKAVLSWLSIESGSIESTLDVTYRKHIVSKIQNLMSDMPKDEVVDLLGELCKPDSI